MSRQSIRGTVGRPQETDPQSGVRTVQDEREAFITELFRARAKELAGLFPADGMTLVARARSSAIMASRSVALRNASPESICEQAVACHHLGLELGDQAYLVPYKDQAQLIVGPRGLIALMYRSGFVKSVEARCVFEGDAFEYDLGDSGFIRHRKSLGRRSSVITHAYFFAHTSTGGIAREVLTADDLEYFRSFSKASKGPWFDNYEGMCRKTAIKRGAEFVPRSPLLVAALGEDERGGYEIPEEIMQAVRGRVERQVTAPEAVPEQPQEETVYLGATAREPGEEG